MFGNIRGINLFYTHIIIWFMPHKFVQCWMQSRLKRIAFISYMGFLFQNKIYWSIWNVEFEIYVEGDTFVHCSLVMTTTCIMHIFWIFNTQLTEIEPHFFLVIRWTRNFFLHREFNWMVEKVIKRKRNQSIMYELWWPKIPCERRAHKSLSIDMFGFSFEKKKKEMSVRILQK